MREIKILWFEDETDWLDPTEKLINKSISKYMSRLNITLESDVDLFMQKLEKDSSTNKFSNYDIIVVDYNLSSDDYKGSQIIEKLTKFKIYGDIVFYSENSLQEIKKLLKENIGNPIYECVYISERKNLKEKIASVVEKIYYRSNDLAFARGNLLDQSANLEFLLKELGVCCYQSLDKIGKELIWDDINKKLEKTYKDIKDNYNSTRENVLKKEIRKIMDSIFYILSSRQKEDIVLKMLELSGAKISEQAKFENSFKDLISIRNSLAHKKIIISKCGNYLKLFNNLEELKNDKCDCKNHTDNSKISKSKYDETIMQNYFIENVLEGFIKNYK